MIDQSLLFLFPAAMAFAAAMDMLTMTIPNRISLVLIASFFVAAYFAGLSGHQVLMHLATGAVVLAAGFALFAARVFGGGDAKLLAASSLWIGFEHLFDYVYLIAVFGGFLAFAILIGRKFFPEGSLRAPKWVLRLQSRESGIPYGLAITASALFIYPSTDFFRGLAF
ncbi:MAG: prepilin peptidase [Hyphomicrobiaceae bacterium]|nr:prepilin peptidase [Hyphomicrobiaceae bacterium]